MKLSRKKVIELLRSGDFTLVYWDRNDPTLYKGKWDYNKEFVKDEYKTMDKSIIEIKSTLPWSNSDDGYCPWFTTLLVKALKGKSDSI